MKEWKISKKKADKTYVSIEVERGCVWREKESQLDSELHKWKTSNSEKKGKQQDEYN